MEKKLTEFKPRYKKWVEESLSDWQAGNYQKVVTKYPLLTFDNSPWTPYVGKARDHRFAVVTSGGLYVKDEQPPFETASIHGDTSFREIPKDVKHEQLEFAHAHFDHSLVEADLNCIFPLDRFKELESEGVVGSVSETHYSFSYVNDIVPLVEETAPKMIADLKKNDVNAVFLVPV